jgi:hypothetical protein
MDNQLLDKFLRPINSPVTMNKGRMTGIEFERQFSVQSSKMRASKISVQNFIQESETDEATGSFNTGQSLLITTTLDPENLYTGAKTMGVPLISVYQGTVIDDTLQIYPRSGSSIDPTDYIFDFGFDWGSANSDGSNQIAMLAIENVGAGSVNILVKVKWKYLANRDGSFQVG